MTFERLTFILSLLLINSVVFAQDNDLPEKICIEQSLDRFLIPNIDLIQNKTTTFSQYEGCVADNYTLVADPCLNQFYLDAAPRLFFFLLTKKDKNQLSCVFSTNFLLNNSECRFSSKILYYSELNISIIKVFEKNNTEINNKNNLVQSKSPLMIAAFPSVSSKCMYYGRLDPKDRKNLIITIFFAILATIVITAMYITLVQTGFIRDEQTLIQLNQSHTI